MTESNGSMPIVCIMGPTASGKTDLAVSLVQRFPFDIISVDSAMVYREMNIGTAKPDASILEQAPHRLIDILDPAESYSAASFREDALAHIETIYQAGRWPLLVGGTMLYFRVLQQGLSPLPEADPAVRARLEQERLQYGNQVLHARLLKIDPDSAARIHPNDPQRVQRALEVYEITGQTVTELYRQKDHKHLPFPLLRLALVPGDRHFLRQRISERFQQMLEKGFVEEVEKLRARPDLDINKPSIRALGYRQIWEFLDGKTDYAEMVQRGIIATRQFAKRQLTWLRAEQEVICLDTLQPKILDRVLLLLNKYCWAHEI